MTRTREGKGGSPIKGSSRDPLRRQRRPSRSAESSSSADRLISSSAAVGSLLASRPQPLRLSRQNAITRLRKRAAQPRRLSRSQPLGGVLLRGLSLSVVLGLMMAGLSQLLQSTAPALPERTLTPASLAESGESPLSALPTDISTGEGIPALQERLATLADQP
ncbi:MAG: hypothetical protein Q6M04_02500, partial [Thermostichus sp. BF3_bins_97]